jgi:predicted secreted protein
LKNIRQWHVWATCGLFLLTGLAVWGKAPIRQTIESHVGDSVTIEVEYHRGTGYEWRLDNRPDPNVIRLEKQSIDTDGTKKGRPTVQVFRFKSLAKGEATVVLRYLRPFDKAIEPKKELHIKFLVK